MMKVKSPLKSESLILLGARHNRFQDAFTAHGLGITAVGLLAESIANEFAPVGVL